MLFRAAQKEKNGKERKKKKKSEWGVGGGEWGGRENRWGPWCVRVRAEGTHDARGQKQSAGVDQKLLINGFLFFPGSLRWKTIGKALARSTGGKGNDWYGVGRVGARCCCIDGGCCVRKKNKDNGVKDNGKRDNE